MNDRISVDDPARPHRRQDDYPSADRGDDPADRRGRGDRRGGDGKEDRRADRKERGSEDAKEDKPENTGKDAKKGDADPKSKDADKEGGDKEGGDKKDDKKGDDKPSPLKKTWVRVVIGVVVVALLVAGGLWFYRYWTHGRFVESTNNAYLQADQVTVSAKVAGTVTDVFVEDNQQVHQGDPLAKIDDRTPREQVRQAQAQAAQARATVVQYEAQIAEQRATIAQGDAAVRGAESQRRYQQGEVDRYAPLVASGAETAEQLAQKVANRDQAESTLRQNQAQATQARRRVATLSAQIGTAQAQVAQAEAQARQAQIDVGNALVTASIDGRVGDRQVRVGLEAQIGTRLLTVVPVQAIYLVANFKETQIGQMRIGQPATIKVDALDGAEVSGTVDSFSPATGASFALIPANNATGNFTKIVQRVPVRIRIDAGQEARKVLVPGLSVEVSVDTLGAAKRDEAARKDEQDQGKPQREQQMKEGVDRDRQQAASGSGR